MFDLLLKFGLEAFKLNPSKEVHDKDNEEQSDGRDDNDDNVDDDDNHGDDDENQEDKGDSEEEENATATDSTAMSVLNILTDLLDSEVLPLLDITFYSVISVGRMEGRKK